MKYLFAPFYEEDLDLETGEYFTSEIIEITPHEADCLADAWIKACRIAGYSGKRLVKMDYLGLVTD